VAAFNKFVALDEKKHLEKIDEECLKIDAEEKRLCFVSGENSDLNLS